MTDNNNNNIKKTISVIGSAKAGKTTLIEFLRTGNPVQQELDPTEGIELRKNAVNVGNNSFRVIDTSGQSNYQDMWELAITYADIVIFVFDATLHSVLLNNPKYVNIIQEQLIYVKQLLENQLFIILLNKQDLINSNPIKKDSFLSLFSIQKDIHIYEVSAKYGTGFEKFLQDIEGDAVVTPLKLTRDERDPSLKFKDLLDLNLTEFTILLFIIDIASQKPILRFTLYHIVSKFLSLTKTLSASSFYNTLNKLNERKLCQLVESEERGQQSVIATNLTRLAINEVIKTSLFSYRAIFSSIEEKLVNKFKKSYSNISQKNQKILFIQFQNFNSLGIISAIQEISPNLFIIAENSQINFLKDLLQSPFNHTQVIDSTIHSPAQFYDQVIIFGFSDYSMSMGLAMSTFFDEIYRVTKKNAFLSIIGINKINIGDLGIYAELLGDLLTVNEVISVRDTDLMFYSKEYKLSILENVISSGFLLYVLKK
ncbi:MAG: GTPase domain-containing protein [Candidatus Thorarchaeota archaeon]